MSNYLDDIKKGVWLGIAKGLEKLLRVAKANDKLAAYADCVQEFLDNQGKTGISPNEVAEACNELIAFAETMTGGDYTAFVEGLTALREYALEKEA